jgi:Zn-dependent membrane protease YugP
MLGISILLLVITLGLANFARQRADGVILQGKRIPIPNGGTVLQLTRQFLDENEAEDVRIIGHNALVSDYFDPRRRCLYLNEDVMKGTDAGSLAVAMHEAAHALQLDEARTALDWRLSTIKVTRYVPTLVGIGALALMVLKRLPFPRVFMAVSLIWFLIMLANVTSMPIETNASQRALAWLERRMSKYSNFVESMTKLLKEAAYRDTGAFTRSPLYMLFGALPVGGRLRPKK